MKEDTKSLIIGVLFSFVPYALVSWGYTALTDGGATDFWKALGVLFLARLFFSLIETLGSILTWRVYGRKRTVKKYVDLLRENNFPKREDVEEKDIENYLFRIQEDDSGFSAANKTAARDMQFALEALERFGMLLGSRSWSAAQTALDLYSPLSPAAFDHMFRPPDESE